VKLIERRRRVAAAEAKMRQERRTWLAETIPLRAWCADHRAALIVAGGLVSGAATSLLPLRPLMKLGSAFASTAMLMLRFPLADLIAWREGERASGDAAAGNAQ